MSESSESEPEAARPGKRRRVVESDSDGDETEEEAARPTVGVVERVKEELRAQADGVVEVADEPEAGEPGAGEVKAERLEAAFSAEQIARFRAAKAARASRGTAARPSMGMQALRKAEDARKAALKVDASSMFEESSFKNDDDADADATPEHLKGKIKRLKAPKMQERVRALRKQEEANQAQLKIREEKASRTAFVGGIGSNVEEEDVRAVFSKYGHINLIRMNTDDGFCWVEYENKHNVASAIRALDGIQTLDGLAAEDSKITVCVSTDMWDKHEAEDGDWERSLDPDVGAKLPGLGQDMYDFVPHLDAVNTPDDMTLQQQAQLPARDLVNYRDQAGGALY